MGPDTPARVTAENPVGLFGAPAALLQAAQGTDLKILATRNVRLEDVVDDRLVRKLDEAGVVDPLYATYGAK